MLALGNKPPTRYMGGKARFARAILAAMGITDRPERVVLSDVGPWGETWSLLADPSSRHLIRSWLAEWLGYYTDHGRLYDKLITAPVPTGPHLRVASFLVLQTLNWRTKPVSIVDGRWKHAGLDKTMAYGVPGTPRFGEVKPQLPVLRRRLDGLSHLDRVSGSSTDARLIEVPGGSLVYIDPPYAETQSYGNMGTAELSRSDVLLTSTRWVREGARVALSEAEPVRDPPFCRWVQVGAKGKSAGLTNKPRAEWLSLSW